MPYIRFSDVGFEELRSKLEETFEELGYKYTRGRERYFYVYTPEEGKRVVRREIPYVAKKLKVEYPDYEYEMEIRASVREGIDANKVDILSITKKPTLKYRLKLFATISGFWSAIMGAFMALVVVNPLKPPSPELFLSRFGYFSLPGLIGGLATAIAWPERTLSEEDIQKSDEFQQLLKKLYSKV